LDYARVHRVKSGAANILAFDSAASVSPLRGRVNLNQQTKFLVRLERDGFN
jgi:hypothetical protein